MYLYPALGARATSSGIIGGVIDPAALLQGLECAARRGGAIAQDARLHMVRDLKPDGSMVTNGDREVETYLRGELATLVEDSTFWGEEFGFAEEGSGGLWVIDPIDGTSNYSYGSPLWGVSIAWIVGDRIEAGAVMLPDLDELYLCVRGHGVTVNDAPLPPIPPGRIATSELVSYSDYVVKACPRGDLPGKMRCSGAFVVDGTFVLRQRLRGLIGLSEKLYDMAACALMAQELGADVRYADGRPLDIGALKADRKIAKPWLIFPSGSGFLLGV